MRTVVPTVLPLICRKDPEIKYVKTTQEARRLKKYIRFKSLFIRRQCCIWMYKNVLWNYFVHNSVWINMLAYCGVSYNNDDLIVRV